MDDTMSLLDASVLNCLFRPRYMTMGLCVRLKPTSGLFAAKADQFYRQIKQVDVEELMEREENVKSTGSEKFITVVRIWQMWRICKWQRIIWNETWFAFSKSAWSRASPVSVWNLLIIFPHWPCFQWQAWLMSIMWIFLSITFLPKILRSISHRCKSCAWRHWLAMRSVCWTFAHQITWTFFVLNFRASI